MDVIEKIDRLRKERGWSVNYLAMEAMLTQEEEGGKNDKREGEEQEEELVRKVKALSPKAKEGLLLLLKDLPS